MIIPIDKQMFQGGWNLSPKPSQVIVEGYFLKPEEADVGTGRATVGTGLPENSLDKNDRLWFLESVTTQLQNSGFGESWRFMPWG